MSFLGPERDRERPISQADKAWVQLVIPDLRAGEITRSTADPS
jgi:hypothetical protein